jgi:hypothetical protein
MRTNPEMPETGSGREIPCREWKAFFQQFSQDHYEWLVSVEEHGQGSRTTHEANGLPFEALTLHLDHACEVFSIIVRNDITKTHVYQSIRQPQRVKVERAGSDVRLRIDSTEGFVTIFRFHRVATPDYDSETIRGIAENEGRLMQS